MKDSNNNQLKNDFKLINKEVKNAVQRQKNENLHQKILEMEEDFRKNNTHKLFNSVKQLERKKPNSLLAVKDTNGDLHIKINDILNIWKVHFESHLNREFSREEGALLEFECPTSLSEEDVFPSITEEVKNAIKQLKNRKAPGTDGITSELLKAGGQLT